MAASLYLLSRLDAHTAYRVVAIDMVVLGAGIGLCVQVLTIIELTLIGSSVPRERPSMRQIR